MTDCFETDHFYLDEAGRLVPQPWMQYRHVGSVSAPSRSASYKASGGGNKNELLHNLSLNWLNDSPIPQHCFGTISRGGIQVSLQARSRGYVSTFSGMAIDATPALTESSRTGVGADIGRAGTLSIGTGFCTAEVREQSSTIPLVPEYTGWPTLTPGQTLHAIVQVRFISEAWEQSAINGGDTGTESYYISGDTRLDLFAVPVL